MWNVVKRLCLFFLHFKLLREEGRQTAFCLGYFVLNGRINLLLKASPIMVLWRLLNKSIWIKILQINWHIIESWQLSLESHLELKHFYFLNLITVIPFNLYDHLIWMRGGGIGKKIDFSTECVQCGECDAYNAYIFEPNIHFFRIFLSNTSTPPPPIPSPRPSSHSPPTSSLPFII